MSAETVKVGRKVFTAEACENNWGQFLRLTEDVEGRKNSVCIPSADVDTVAGVIMRAAAKAWGAAKG